MQTLRALDLEPCPFCGAKPSLEVWEFDGGKLFNIRCPNCNTMQPQRDTLDAVIKRWNMREAL